MSTESLFLALANVEHAAQSARARIRIRRGDRADTGLPVDPDELATVIRLIDRITTQLGVTVWAYGQALHRGRNHAPMVLSPPTYAVAREFHTLATRLRRGVDIGAGLNAITTLDTAFRDWRARIRRRSTDGN